MSDPHALCKPLLTLAALGLLVGSTLLGLSGCGLSGCGLSGCDEERRTEIPTARVPRVHRAPNLDGRLDESEWSRAARTEEFVNTMDGSEAAPETMARMLWDDDHLYIAFEVQDDYLKCTLTGHDPHLWEQDTVEVMVDPDGDGLDYVELQVSPTNQVFDTRYDRRRVPQPFGHVDYESGVRAGVQVRGHVNDEGRDQGYTVEMAIPWSAFHHGLPERHPIEGRTWRVALYVLDARPQGQGGVGWSPPLVGDFHVPDRFGRVIFEEE